MKRARILFPTGFVGFRVAEGIRGGATTDFGAPEKVTTRDIKPLPQSEAERLADLVSAAWAVFDQVAAGAPAALRKGPRGGGRDRDKIVDHVLGTETAYVRKLGSLAATLRCAADRLARDHAWEIEDRSDPSS